MPRAQLEILEAQLKSATETAAKLRLAKAAGKTGSATADPANASELSETPESNSLLSGGNSPTRFYRVARLAHGFADGWGAGLGTVPPGVVTNTVAVSASGRDGFNSQPFGHSLALQCDGHVRAWGATNFGQTLVPTNLTAVVAVAAGARHSVALLEDGHLAAWGDNSLGQVTNVPPNLTNIVDVKAGL